MKCFEDALRLDFLGFCSQGVCLSHEALEDIVTEAFEEVLKSRIHNNSNTQNSLSTVMVTKVQDMRSAAQQPTQTFRCMKWFSWLLGFLCRENVAQRKTLLIGEKFGEKFAQKILLGRTMDLF